MEWTVMRSISGLGNYIIWGEECVGQHSKPSPDGRLTHSGVRKRSSLAELGPMYRVQPYTEVCGEGHVVIHFTACRQPDLTWTGTALHEED